MIKDDIKGSISTILERLSLAEKDIHIEHSNNLKNGDYSTNVAMILGKKLGKKPRELADVIVDEYVKNKPEYIKKIVVAEPGFINFYLTREFFVESVNKILNEGEKWGSNDTLSGKKIMVEYTDPNPFKEFHIGHLVPNALGESLSRILEFSGASVKRANYQGDIGLHVAKAVWGILKLGKNAATVLAADLGEAYANGAKAYEESGDAKNEIDELNKKIYDKNDPYVNELYEKGKQLSLDRFEIMYKKLGTAFDFYFFESETIRSGLEMVSSHLGDIFEESDGAIVFKAEKYLPAAQSGASRQAGDLHTRVFVTSRGLPTYEAKELGLAVMKYNSYPFDISITVTGKEQKEYFHVVVKALEQINLELSKKIHLVVNGMLRLSTGKMSSRTGDVITAESLISDVQNIIMKKMADQNFEDKENIAEQIAVGAIKYTILKQASGKDIVFDFEKSLSFTGDSGPYLQYTYARARSIIRKAEEKEVMPSITYYPIHSFDVERLIYRFPEVVLRAMEESEPHYITTYLTSLSSAFNTYYADEKILDGSRKESYKVALAKAVAITIKNGLWLLGIKSPERM